MQYPPSKKQQRDTQSKQGVLMFLLLSSIEQKKTEFDKTNVSRGVRKETAFWASCKDCGEARGGVVVDALCYKPEGRGFEIRGNELFFFHFI
jgi:hypothetical protein